MHDYPAAESRVTLAMILSAAGAALGGLLFGFDTAVISGTTAALQSQFVLSDGARLPASTKAYLKDAMAASPTRPSGG